MDPIHSIWKAAWVFSCVGAIQAQPTWQPVGGPSMAPVLSVTATGPSLLAGSMSGIFRRDPATGTWSPTSRLGSWHPEFLWTVDTLTFAADSSSLVFRSGDGGRTSFELAGWYGTMTSPRSIFRSEGRLAMKMADGHYLYSQDEGLTWAPMQDNHSANSLAILALDSMFYYTGDFGVYESDRWGNHERSMSVGLPAGKTNLSLAWVQGKMFTLVTDSGLYVSTDRALTWSKVDGGLVKTGIGKSNGVTMAARPGLILLSDRGYGGMSGSKDSGRTWTALNNGLPSFIENGKPYYPNSAVLFRGDTALVSTDLGIYRSMDGGAHWKAANQGLPGAESGTNIVSFCEGAGDLYVTYSDGQGLAPSAYRSRDAGRTWARADSKLDGLRVMRASGRDIYARMDNSGEAAALAHSPDSGKTWQAIHGPWSAMGIWNFVIMDADLFVWGNEASFWHSRDKGLTWTVVEDGRPSARAGAKLFRAFGNRLKQSTDSGASWTGFPTNFGDSIIKVQAAPGLLSMRSGNRLHISIDDGVSWEAATDAVSKLSVNDMAQSGSAPYTAIYAATDKGLLESRDSGKGWTTLANGLPELEIAALAAGGTRLYAADIFGLHVQDRPGAPWNRALSAPAGIIGMAAWKDLVLAENPQGLWLSKDAGQSWHAVDNGLSGAKASAMAMGAGLILIQSDKGLYRSKDGGATWLHMAAVNLPTGKTSLAIGEGALYASVAQGVFLSRDSGATWTNTTTEKFVVWGPILAEGGFLYKDYGVNTAVSKDQGNSWVSYADNPPAIATAFVSANGRILAVFPGLGIRSLEMNPTHLVSRPPALAPAQSSIRISRAGSAGTFRFRLARKSRVSWSLFTLSGKKVDGLVSEALDAGTHDFAWQGGTGSHGLIYRAEIRPESEQGPENAPPRAMVKTGVVLP